MDPIEKYSTHSVNRAQNLMERRRMWIGLSVLVIGASVGLLMARRKSANPKIAKAATWRQVLIQKRGTIEAEVLLDKLQQRYEELYDTRPHYDHPALRKHLEQNILPGLALYQVLQAEKADQTAALAEVEQLLHASAERSGLRHTTAALKYLPEPFRLFRPMVHAAMHLSYPPAGWEMEWVENSAQRVAFNIQRCFYLNTLTAYGAPELTRLFCQMDDVVYEALPPSIKWERTGTLARGYAACDFCYRHIA
ncbi:hypothetical protein TFLX_00143 [Thermoflexales bacterium]|nr:hypothetical protein TFLX_00143 [Thermoflexales bacterium]